MIRPAALLVLLLFPCSALAAQDFYVGTNRLEQLRSEVFAQAEQGDSCQIISVSGLIEVEGSYTREKLDDRSKRDAFDLVLDEARLGIDVQVTPWSGGTMAFSYQEEVGEPELDEATVNLDFGPLRSRIGRQLLPLGLYRSWLVSDPLTRELGETHGTALSLALTGYHLELSGFLLRSHYEDKENVENRLHDWGGALRATFGNTLTLGGAYLNDFAESDADLVSHPYRQRTGCWSAWLRLMTPHLKLRGEVVSALKRFDPLDLDRDLDGRGDTPRAWLTELAIPLTSSLECALRYEGSHEFFGFPERQYGADVTWTILTGTTLSLEALHGEFDRAFSPSAGIDTRERLTMQMAVSF